jgi:peptidoglycan/LPS O-acetylase OafA/YrhL
VLPVSTRSIPAHVPAVDGFRGLAALLVLLFHCWTITDPPLDSGPLRELAGSAELGVDFFFVISGFVLFLPVVRQRGRFGSVRDYAVRRVARIATAYDLALLVQGAARPLLRPGWPTPFTSAAGLAALAAHFLFLQHMVPQWLFRELGNEGGGMGLGVNGALWSLSIEAIFYVVLPIVAGFYFRRPGLALAAAVAAAALWRLVAYRLGPVSTALEAAAATAAVPRLVGQFPGYLAHFAFGMSGALAYGAACRGEGGAFLRRVGGSAVAVAAAALLAAMMARGIARASDATFYQRYLGDVVAALAFAALMTITASAPVRAQFPFAHPFCRWLGDVSYGVFLWHFPLLLLFSHALGWVAGSGGRPFALALLLVAPSSLLFGWLSRRFVEEPAIAGARRRTLPSDSARGSRPGGGCDGARGQSPLV